MTVSQLIAYLSRLPSNEDVSYVWDGLVRTDVEALWLSRENGVVLSGCDHAVYHEADRPHDSPTRAAEPCWEPPPGLVEYPRKPTDKSVEKV